MKINQWEGQPSHLKTIKMTILKTPKQREREERNRLALAIYKEVQTTCVGTMRQMCIETARRMKKHGYAMHEVSIFKLIKKQQS